MTRERRHAKADEIEEPEEGVEPTTAEEGVEPVKPRRPELKGRAEGTPGTNKVAGPCKPEDRAGDGLLRFKVRADGMPAGVPAQYYLAADADAARAMYREKMGWNEEDAPAGEEPKEGDKPKGVRIVVKKLPD